MLTKAFSKLLVAMCLVAALAACSDDGGTEAEDTASPGGTSSGTPDSADEEAICLALAEVNQNAETLQADLPGEERDVLGNDLSNLGMSISNLITALQQAARAEVEQLQTAWDEVTTTFEGLEDDTDLEQAQEQLQPAVADLRTALDGVTEGSSCS